jgi:hypothetical protein
VMGLVCGMCMPTLKPHGYVPFFHFYDFGVGTQTFLESTCHCSRVQICTHIIQLVLWDFW